MFIDNQRVHSAGEAEGVKLEDIPAEVRYII
jgi:hypothetical protein